MPTICTTHVCSKLLLFMEFICGGTTLHHCCCLKFYLLEIKWRKKRQKRCKNEKDRPSICTGKGAALLKAVSDLALQVPQRRILWRFTTLKRKSSKRPTRAIEDGACTEQDDIDRSKADYLRESDAWRGNQFLQI